MAALSTLLPVFAMLGLGMASRIRGWVTPEQKAGANRIVFGVLFPVMIFNLLASASLSLDVLPVVGYVFAMYLLALLVIGPLTARFTGAETAHFSKYLLATHEGGNVALPLYLSIVGVSSTTVIFDLAGSTICELLSYQNSYYTDEYNIMYDFGGLRLMKYNYSDAEWAEFVASQNGELHYE
jgi:predicted permease